MTVQHERMAMPNAGEQMPSRPSRGEPEVDEIRDDRPVPELEWELAEADRAWGTSRLGLGITCVP